jgi:biotin-(acetyl-CoA carboxylase) ligase
LKPIRWTVRRVSGKSPRDTGGESNTVFLRDPDTSPSLCFSAHTTCGDETALLLGLIAAFSASEGVRKDTGIISWIRWPNLVTIGGKTVATTHASVSRMRGRARAHLDFSVNLSGADGVGQTSLRDEIGVDVDRNLLMEKVLESLSWMQFGWSNDMHYQVLRRVRSMTETIGSSVVLVSGARGVAKDVDPKGRLVVRLSDGKTLELEREDELAPPL